MAMERRKLLPYIYMTPIPQGRNQIAASERGIYLHRHEVSEGLQRVVQVGQRVDHRHVCLGLQLLDVGVRVDARQQQAVESGQNLNSREFARASEAVSAVGRGKACV